jgi:hypothetical protein
LQRRTQRFIFFSLAILVGLAAGIFFGWQVAPARYTDTSPDTLRQDYQTDFVLMVAELYGHDADQAMATSRLTYLSLMPPLDTVQAAIAYAQKNNYKADDLQLMFHLAEAIETRPLPLEQGWVD